MPRREDAEPRKAVVYLRQSLDKAGDELAVTRQREDCYRIAKERGWAVAAEYVDNSISASDRWVSRPSYDEMVTAYKAGGFNVIICWDLDRLTRQPRQLEDWIEAAESRNLTIVTANGEADLSTDGGRMYARVKAAVARAEIERKSARHKRANLQAAQAGRRIGGRRPFGYEQDGKTIRLNEAAAIKNAYMNYLTGTNLVQIARDWNERGFAAQKAPWNRTTVRQVLINPRYMGWRGYAPLREGKRGRPVQEPVAKAEWPPIVSENLWHGVNAMLTSKSRPVGRGARLLLTGVALCGVCVAEDDLDAAVHGGGSVAKYLMYRCSRTYGHVQRKAEPVDDWVSAYAVARLQRKDARELLSSKPSADMAELRAEYEGIAKRKDQFVDELQDDLSPADFGRMVARFNRKMENLEQQMADDGRNAVLGPLIGADDVEAIWESTPREQQRRVISSLFTVTLLQSKVGSQRFDPDSVIVEPRRELRPVPPLRDGVKQRVGRKKDRSKLKKETE